jgi:hypothetical protein
MISWLRALTKGLAGHAGRRFKKIFPAGQHKLGKIIVKDKIGGN